MGAAWTVGTGLAVGAALAAGAGFAGGVWSARAALHVRRNAHATAAVAGSRVRYLGRSMQRPPEFSSRGDREPWTRTQYSFRRRRDSRGIVRPSGDPTEWVE